MRVPIDPTTQFSDHFCCGFSLAESFSTGMARLGDWELDTIIGREHKGAVVSMVDRASKLTRLMLVENKTAQAVALAITQALGCFIEVVLDFKPV